MPVPSLRQPTGNQAVKMKICPQCKGKGHIFDAASFLAWFTPLITYFERNDPRGVTRQKCRRCDGEGKIR